jgi:glycosyltransferase involved in cell wall biosynthesis
MRILIVTQYFWPESFLVNDLALGLKERGHEVTVLTGMPNYPRGQLFDGYGLLSPAEESYQGIKTLRVPLVPRGNSRGVRLALNYLSYALSASCLGPRRCKQPFDVILAYQTSPVTVGLPAMLLKWLRGAPLLFWVQDLWPESLSAVGAVRSPWALKQVDRLVRWIYGACDRVLVQSPGFVSNVKTHGVEQERIRVVPNWAEASFTPVDLPADAPERSEFPDGFCFLFAGNVGVGQSFETILAAADLTRDCRDLHWVIMGEGREKSWVAEQIAERKLGSTVHLLAGRPSATMPRYFAAADAMLVSLKRTEIFKLTIPGKVQCYLACGRPILAALDGSAADVIQESGAGVVCPTEDAAALAAAARQLYATDARRLAEMGRNGRRYFEQHFERELVLDRIESIIDEVNGGQRCAA